MLLRDARLSALPPVSELAEVWKDDLGEHGANLERAHLALLVVGGLNWGLVAVAEFDLVAALVGLSFGETNVLSRIVYWLVGAAAVYQAVQLLPVRRSDAPARVSTA